MMRKATIVLAVALSGMASAADPEITRVSPDTYMVVAQNKAGIFGSLPRTRAKALDAANRYAEVRGMTAVPVSMESTPAGGPGQWPTVEYQFRMVPPGDVENRRTDLKPEPDYRLDVRSEIIQAKSEAPATKPDIYTELLKLDDLRKRGILTEDEFQAQKSNLLRER